MKVLSKQHGIDLVEFERLQRNVQVHIGEVSRLTILIQDLSKKIKRPKKYDHKIIDDIIESVCSHLTINNIWKGEDKLNISLVKGKSRKSDIVSLRHAMFYVFRNHFGMPYMKVGDIFNRDHATIMHSIKVIEHRISLQDKIKSYEDDALVYLKEIKIHLGFN